jgi:tRNA A37 threonylcarbamoyladenosine dehydratase
MVNQFSRTELIFGKDAMERLFTAKVAVFGIGGVGGYAVEALARSGVGRIDLFDDDKVCLTNINRQIHATRKTVGKYKVDVAMERILDINPEAEVHAHKLFYTPETSSEVDLSQYDYIIDAIDTMSGKLELVMKAEAAGVPIICSMGAGNKVDPTAFEVADIYKTSVCPLAKIMRYELRRRGIKKLKVVYSKEAPVALKEDMMSSCKTGCICPPGTARKCTHRRAIPGSNAFVPSVVGLIIAGEVIKDLVSDFHSGDKDNSVL